MNGAWGFHDRLRRAAAFVGLATLSWLVVAGLATSVTGSNPGPLPLHAQRGESKRSAKAESTKARLASGEIQTGQGESLRSPRGRKKAGWAEAVDGIVWPHPQHLETVGAVASGDSSSGSVATPIGETYSVHHLVGGDIRGDGTTLCQSIADPALPGEPDDTVTYDGVTEATRTDILGTVPLVTESKTDNGDGTHLLIIETFSESGADLFPDGLTDPNTETPLTDACFFIGLAAPPFGDPLNWEGVDTVTDAAISYLQDGAVVVGPIDVTGQPFFSDPWNGLFGHTLPGGAQLGINGMRLEILVGKTLAGPVGACCVAGECIGDLVEDSCTFQGGTWTPGASCGADPTLPAPVCSQTECSFNNGSWLDDFGGPISQYAPDQLLSRAAADDFTLAGTADESCWISNVRVWMSHTVAGTDPGLDYQGVNVTIYGNDDPKDPDGEPQNDGSHIANSLRGILYTQLIPISQVQATPLVSSCLSDVWQLDIPVDVVLNRGTKYWLEVQPVMDGALGNSLWLLSQNNTDHVARRIGGAITSWQEIIGNSDACPGGNPPTPEAETRRNLAFELTGAAVVSPPNDECLDAVVLGDGLVAVNNIGATTDGPDEGDICDEQGTGLTQVVSDVWYEYVAPCTGMLNVNLCRSELSFDSRVAIYGDCGRCPPEDPAVACNDDGCVGRLTSELSAPVVAGTCYRIRVGGFSSPAGEGKGIMEIECVPPPPPTGACCDRLRGGCRNNVEEGNCTGPNDEWTQGVVCADLDPPCIVPGPPHDLCQNAIEVFTDEPYAGSTVNATGEDITTCTVSDVNDVWHVWTADCNGAAVISLCDSGYDTSLAVFDGCDGTQLACNDDSASCINNTFRSEISPEEYVLPVLVGESYYIRVSGWSRLTGEYNLHVKSCLSACCTTDGRVCLHREPAECTAGGGIPHPGLICTGDGDGNGIRDVCELPVEEWYFLDSNGEQAGGYLPDFDQNKDYDDADQDGDPTTGVDDFYGGPAAVADSFWWLHQKFPDVGVVDVETSKTGLIEDLATRMGTNGTPEHPSPTGRMGPYTGTFLDDIQAGLNDYLADRKLNGVFSELTEPEPTYDFVSGEVMQDRNVTLQLGFYHVESVEPIGDPPTGYVVSWRRTGGHYATVAGVEPVTRKIALSDPDADAAEEDGADFVRGADHDHDGDGDPGTTLPFRDAGYDHVIHNDKTLASHDVYEARPAFDGATSDSEIPGGAWLLALAGDALAYGATMAPFHQEDAGGAFDVADGTFLDAAFLQQNGYPTPEVCQTYTVVEAAVVISTRPDQPCCRSDGACDVAAPTTCVSQGGAPLGTEAACLGDLDESGVDDACSGCLHVRISSVLPASGTVDARQPHPPDAPATRQGIGSTFEPIAILLSPPVDGAEACFNVCETVVDPIFGPNSLTATHHGHGEYQIVLDHAITAGAFTAIEYKGSGDSVGYMNHPANVDGNEGSDAVDVRAMIDCCLLGSCEPAWGLYSCDLDHSGVVGPADLLRAADLLNGAGDFELWDGTSRPAGSSCP